MYVYTNAYAKTDVFFIRFCLSEAIPRNICSEKDFVFACLRIL